jgi:hypothetical protein
LPQSAPVDRLAEQAAALNPQIGERAIRLKKISFQCAWLMRLNLLRRKLG